MRLASRKRGFHAPKRKPGTIFMSEISRQVHVGALSGARVVCVGDVMLDRFVYGQVERISPEAPIPVLRVKDERSMLGGAGNVARNLAALEASVSFVSVVGEDDAGQSLARLFDELDGVTAALLPVSGRPTTIKTRYISMSQQMLRADRETAEAVARETGDAIVASVSTRLGEADILVLSDYGKGVLTPYVCEKLIAAAKTAKVPVLVDPKGRDYARYHGADLITPNRQELSEASGLPVDSDEAVVAAAQALMTKTEIGAVVATRSEDGMSVVVRKGEPHHFPAEAREVFDVSGAGDTVVATLAAALSGGLSLPQAALLANAAAGIVVGKVGTAVVYRDELEGKLRDKELSGIEEKVVSLPTACDHVAGWQAGELKVGFTNGCFDLLHPGHVTLLEKSRALCDRLVVGLNSDASVKRLKGEDRPVQPDIARATVLAALGSVDLVVIFEEETPAELIEALRPDVLIKGGDYTVETIVGADFVQANGGRVEIIDLVEGFSTTKTIEKLGK